MVSVGTAGDSDQEGVTTRVMGIVRRGSLTPLTRVAMVKQGWRCVSMLGLGSSANADDVRLSPSKGFSQSHL